jgi:hypothetical protein
MPTIKCGFNDNQIESRSQTAGLEYGLLSLARVDIVNQFASEIIKRHMAGGRPFGKIEANGFSAPGGIGCKHGPIRAGMGESRSLARSGAHGSRGRVRWRRARGGVRRACKTHGRTHTGSCRFGR